MNLQEQGTLLLQDEFTVLKSKRKTTRHIFFFEHLLVFAKTRKIGAGRDQYIYKTSLKVTLSLLICHINIIPYAEFASGLLGKRWTSEAK